MLDYLFQNITAVTMDDRNPVIPGAYVGVRGGKIAYVGAAAPEEDALERFSGEGHVLMPGLVNGHTHVPMTLLRGYADDYDLDTWLNDYIFPAEEKLTAEAARAGTLIALAEMFASGTVSFTDMYSFCDEIASTAAESGIKANISRGIVTFGGDFDFKDHPAGLETAELVDKWHGFDNGRIIIDACIHAEYTNSERTCREVADFARERSLGVHLHLSETGKEHEECVARHGKTPAEFFLSCGVFDNRTVAAHCVHVSDRDMEIMRERGVYAVHNPVSNLKLASGIAKVPELRRRGVRVALGTDGVSSNNSHDMFEEIKLCAVLHKGAAGVPFAVTASETLEMATSGGAASQGRAFMGKIALDYDADVIALDFRAPHLTPCHNAVSNLAYSARGSDVKLTMVRGKTVYRDGEFLTIDYEKARYGAGKWISSSFGGK